MENSTPNLNSIEMQIDNFLEHFNSKWSVSSRNNRNSSDLSDNDIETVLSEVRTTVTTSTRSQLNSDSSTTSIHNDEEQTQEPEQYSNINFNEDTILQINDVAHLLHPQHAIITGGRSKDGCPLIIFPDNNNFHLLEEIDYQKLVLYLTSVPSMQDADSGFHLIVDRRNDKWASVKTVLLKISEYFPGIIQVVYVLRPSGFFQKAISEVSFKFFKEDFRFRLVICSSLEELHQHIDKSQLTVDMGGTLLYSHHEWIQQRISLEKFSFLTHHVSADLDSFIQAIINDTEFPNSVEATQRLLDYQGLEYERLKDKILSAAKHGENLLNTIKQTSEIKEFSERTGNVSSIESSQSSAGSSSFKPQHHDCNDYHRLLIQLEETERRFDDFWKTHQTRLKRCLELRRFEQDFRELQAIFDGYLKTISDMTEIGESVLRISTLIKETNIFQKICQSDIERAEQVISSGQLLIGAYPSEVIQPKCDELIRFCDLVNDRLIKRLQNLEKHYELMESIEKANAWCAKGVELLTTPKIEKCSSAEMAEQCLQEIQEFINSAAEFTLSTPKEFRNIFIESSTQETKALATQVLQRIDDVSLMCDKRINSLKKLTAKPPVQIVQPEPAVPLQPPGGAPNLLRKKQKNDFNDLRPISVEGGDIIDSGISSTETQNIDNENKQDLEARRLKRGHVLHELLETERIYVTEMDSILKGYKDQMQSEELAHLVPAGLQGKEDILFGNLNELFSFHSEIFLKDLENCISTTELVALCFVQRRDTFYRLYSYYCQNIPRSERLRETLVDTHLFLQECQKRLGHKLPLAAYLLKPVQRITKYQLLLKDLLRFSDNGQCCKELQKALDCMLIVLKCVNDSMHQIAITGFPTDLSQQGELLLQDSFQVWSDNKRDIRIRLKPQQRHIFLYHKAMLFCKQVSKTGHNKSTYQFKNYVKMSQIGLTESVRGDQKRFEIWLQGRQEVHTLQATTIDIKNKWVAEIKRVLVNQLEELKGEKIKQYGAHKRNHIKQTISWDNPTILPTLRAINYETSSCSGESNRNSNCSDEQQFGGISSSSSEKDNNDLTVINCPGGSGWASDYSNSDDELSVVEDNTTPGNKYTALADYVAVSNSEVSIRESDHIELLKIGYAGWWFVKNLDTNFEGWTPAAYLESMNKKSSRCPSRNQDKI